MKNNIFKIAVGVWVILWAWFLIRELFVKDNIDTYGALLQRSLEGKRSYVTGDRLYEFLTFCGNKMPEGSSYKIAGLEDGSLDKRRAAYYLYPDLEGNDPAYILVYDHPSAVYKGYDLLTRLDAQRYILKKTGGD